MLPRLSAPLVKDIRTGEGIAEWLLGLGVSVLTAVGDLGVVKGATLLTILTGVKGIRRGLLKIVALQKDYPMGPPIEPKVLTTVFADVQKAVSEIPSPATDPATADPSAGGAA